jgi:hypothetical protein
MHPRLRSAFPGPRLHRLFSDQIDRAAHAAEEPPPGRSQRGVTPPASPSPCSAQNSKTKPRLDQRSTSGAFRGLAKGAVPHAAPLAANDTRSRVDERQRAVRRRNVLPRPVSPVDKELPERIADGRAKTAGQGSRATRKPNDVYPWPLVGALSRREKEHACSMLSAPPPLTTRSRPKAGPVGSVCGEAG